MQAVSIWRGVAYCWWVLWIIELSEFDGWILSSPTENAAIQFMVLETTKFYERVCISQSQPHHNAAWSNMVVFSFVLMD